MAKGNLFLSQARGKVGSVVFYRKDGEQVTRVYTSQVSNPKTSAQSLQRAIFYSVQRMAAVAKYLVEQGQENVATGTKSRQAFVKRALNDLRSAVLSGQPSVLNVKGNPYAQALPISLTNGSEESMEYNFVDIAEDVPGVDPQYFPTFSGLHATASMTLKDLFNAYPALGLNKQLTLVWLKADENFMNGEGPSIGGLNFHTKLHYSQVVFTDDVNALNLPAFIYDTGSVDGITFNPAVLAPSWGGTDAWPKMGDTWDNATHFTTLGNTIAFTAIVSEYIGGKWSRSYAPFVVNPSAAQSANAVAATYEYGASAVESEQYLDQSDAIDEGQQAGLAPRSIKVNLVDADPISMSRSLAKSVSLSVDSASRIGIQITPMNGDYSADSASVSVSGTADDYTISSPFLLPTAYGKAWVVDLQPTTDPEAGQTTVVAISVAGSTRTLTINWTASV